MPRSQGIQKKRRHDTALPTTIGALAKLAAEHAVRKGIDVDPLLQKANISKSFLGSSETRIAVRSQIQLLNLVADAIQDRFLGFHLACDLDLREMGPLYYLLASANSLGGAMDDAVHFLSNYNEGIRLLRDQNPLSIEFEYVAVERYTDVHQIEFLVTCMVRSSRHFTGREIVPTEVRFSHLRDDDASRMERFFGRKIEFGVGEDRLVFEPHEAELRLSGADPFLHKFLVAYHENMASFQHSGQNLFRARVENAITTHLPNATATIGNVASDLGMSARTLSRRLSEEGSTFSGILDEMRSKLARRYLQNNELSISQIAWLLGYTEVSSFAHAFQRWTGKSPTSARRQINRLERESSRRH